MKKFYLLSINIRFDEKKRKKMEQIIRKKYLNTMKDKY
jgi:hypothetical protein